MVQVPKIVKRDDGTFAVVIRSPEGDEEVLSEGLTEEQADNALDGALQALEYDGE